MELIHSTFQASFNARIERLAEQEANELRTVRPSTVVSPRRDAFYWAGRVQIFRYFDSDGDGVVSADQVCRMFGLVHAAAGGCQAHLMTRLLVQLGLDVNPAHVLELGDVYLAEFLKIVDSHMPVPVASADQAPTQPSNTSSTTGTNVVPPISAPTAPTSEVAPDKQPMDPASVAAAEAAAIRLKNAQLWEDEWRIVDSYRRGFVTRDELRLFLRSCFSPFPLQDLVRFLEVYSDST